MKDATKHYTTAQVLERFGICRATWYRWLRDIKVRRIKRGKVVRYTEAELARVERALEETLKR